MSILDEIKEETKKDHGYVVELRRYFHSHPELSRQEFNTANKSLNRRSRFYTIYIASLF